MVYMSRWTYYSGVTSFSEAFDCMAVKPRHGVQSPPKMPGQSERGTTVRTREHAIDRVGINAMVRRGERLLNDG